MMNTAPLSNKSEVGTLEKVIMHRPGRELERLTTGNLEELLFDEIPNIHQTHQSHDQFAQYLRDHGVQVFYVKELLLTTLLHSVEARIALCEGIVENSTFNIGLEQEAMLFELREWLLVRAPEQLMEDVISGVTYSRQELGTSTVAETLLQFNNFNNEFIIPPLPNLLFTRDAFSVIEKNVFIWQMAKSARRNEPLIFYTIFRYHPQLSTSGLQIVNWEQLSDDNEHPTIEGGDVAYLGDGVLMIGCGERTNRASIEALARTGLFRRIIAVILPVHRDSMHLDTVLSSVGRHAFTLHGRLANIMEVFTVEAFDISQNMYDTPQWRSHGSDVHRALRQLLNDNELKFYDAQDEATSIVEQRQCRHNVVAIDDCHVMTYAGGDQETGIVAVMIRDGCTVGLIPTKGLLEGCGGAHCMTNAICRRR